MARASSILLLSGFLVASSFLAGCTETKTAADESFEEADYSHWRAGQGADCTKCGPEDDLDGDGYSNRAEVDSGRNPNCNEDTLGAEYCRTGLAPEPVEVHTFGAPPALKLGEWWAIRVTDGFQGIAYETKRVVAGMEGSDYLIGMPQKEFSNEMMVLHIPGFGQVSRDDLSFEIHDERFEPLAFPLVAQGTWDTEFEGRPVTATVNSAGGNEAEIELVGPNGADHMVATYDLEMGEIRSLVIDNYATLEILDHGYNYTGVVTVPHMHDVVFQHGRIGPAATLGLQPAGPEDVVNVASTYDRVSFANIIVGLNENNVGGVCRETATAPDGTVFETTMTPADPGYIRITFHLFDKPGGDWKFQHLAGGACVVLAEGIAYHVYEIDLPTGRILPSTGEHQHGS